MSPALSIHEHLRRVALESAPTLLDCHHCVLLEWEHDDFSAPFWRWYCNDRPGAALLLPGERIDIQPGEIILVPPHTKAGTLLKGKVGHLFIHFTLGMDRSVPTGGILRRQAAGYEQDLVARLVRLAGPEQGGNSMEATFLAQALVNLALAEVPPTHWDGRLLDPRLGQAIKTISRTAGRVDNVALARAAGMNPDAFARKFSAATGYTPHQFGLRLRIERSAERLRQGELSVEQIAAAEGFCDRFHFSRLFKQILGTSPARYRKLGIASLGKKT